MEEMAKAQAQKDRIAGPEEVREGVAALTRGDLVKLQRLAEQAIYRLRRKISGIDAHDLLHEAVLRLLDERRRWKPKKVDLAGEIAGIIASIESDWRKREKRGDVPVLEADLRRNDSEGAEIPTALEGAPDFRPDPEQTLLGSEQLTQEQLFDQIEELFREDALACLIFSEWRRESTGPEIMKALDLTRQQYDTAVRRMDRAIQKRWPEGMPHVH